MALSAVFLSSYARSAYVSYVFSWENTTPYFKNPPPPPEPPEAAADVRGGGSFAADSEPPLLTTGRETAAGKGC